ncbi:MAG: hypothetical protein K2X00_21120 [Nitrospiraceae bacterium]|nr:hypothetical protein [Nitrospiraceae bacterium]
MCNHYKPPSEWRELPRYLQGKVMLPTSNQADIFIDLMMDKPGYEWAIPIYPVIAFIVFHVSPLAINAFSMRSHGSSKEGGQTDIPTAARWTNDRPLELP